MDFFDDFLTAIQQDIASNLSSCIYRLIGACFTLKNIVSEDILHYSWDNGKTDCFWGYSIVIDFYKSTINIATIISAIIFFIQFINISRKMESLNFELLFATLAKVVLARFCIEIGGEVLSATMSTGYSLVEKMFDASGIQAIDLDKYEITLQSLMSNMPQLGFGKSIIMLVTTMIPQLICQLAVLIIEIFGYVRLFEMSVYYCLFPIPCAFLPSEDSRITKKFFLSFAAVCLQGVIMMLILALVIKGMSDEILVNAKSEWGTGWDFVTTGTLRMVLWSILAVVGIGQSSKWASKIVEY